MPVDISATGATRTTTRRAFPVSGWKRGLILRATLVVLAAITVLVGAPAIVTGPLIAAAVVLVAERVVRRRGRGTVDLVVTATAAPIVAAALLGIALNLLPAGLTAVSWAVGGAVVALLALGITARAEARTGVTSGRTPDAAGAVSSLLRRRPSWFTVAFLTAAVTVLAGAWWVAVQSTAQVETAPLALSAAGGGPGDRTAVLLSSGTDRTGLRLTMTADGDDTVLADGLAVGPEADVSVPVTVPGTGRVVLRLTDPADPADTGRELIFDNGRPEGT